MPSSSHATTGARTRWTTSERLVDDWVELHGDRDGRRRSRDRRRRRLASAAARSRSSATRRAATSRSAPTATSACARPAGLRQGTPRVRAGRPSRLPGRDDGRHAGRVSGRRAPSRPARPARSRSSMLAMARLRVPSVAFVIGEGGSGGALAIGVADRVLMLEHSIYSVISPEGCATILWRDVGPAPQGRGRVQADGALLPRARRRRRRRARAVGRRAQGSRACRAAARRLRSRRRSTRSRPSRPRCAATGGARSSASMGVWLETTRHRRPRRRGRRRAGRRSSSAIQATARPTRSSARIV